MSGILHIFMKNNIYLSIKHDLFLITGVEGWAKGIRMVIVEVSG